MTTSQRAHDFGRVFFAPPRAERRWLPAARISSFKQSRRRPIRCKSQSRKPSCHAVSPTLTIEHRTARMYDHALGRFTRRDDVGITVGSYNLYLFVGSHPFDYLDPVGREIVSKKSSPPSVPGAPVCTVLMNDHYSDIGINKRNEFVTTFESTVGTCPPEQWREVAITITGKGFLKEFEKDLNNDRHAIAKMIVIV